MLAFQELLIDISIEQANALVNNLSPNKTKKVQVHTIMEYLNNQLNHMVKQNRASGLLPAAADTPTAKPGTRTKGEGFDPKASRQAIPKPVRKSGTMEVSKAEEDKAENPPTQPEAPGGKKRPVSAAPKMASGDKPEIKNPDADPLPEGWEKRFSKEHGRVSL